MYFKKALEVLFKGVDEDYISLELECKGYRKKLAESHAERQELVIKYEKKIHDIRTRFEKHKKNIRDKNDKLSLENRKLTSLLEESEETINRLSNSENLDYEDELEKKNNLINTIVEMLKVKGLQKSKILKKIDEIL